MAQTEAKSILKEKADILSEKGYLLCKDFRNQVVKDTEAKTKMHNVVRRKKKGAQPQVSTTPQIFFQESPSRQQGYRSSGGGIRIINKFVYQKKGDRLNPKLKVSMIISPFLNRLEFPVVIPGE